MGVTQSSSDLTSTHSTTDPTTTQTDEHDDFKNWKPQNFQWAPDNTKWFESLRYDDDLFETMYNRAPKPGEDVKGLGKAGVVLNGVFGLSDPPSNMTTRECDLIGKSVQIMKERDNNVDIALSITLAGIARVNPQCVNCWKNTICK